MYFISRNNTIYNYIAHTSVKRRYFATLFILAVIVIGCFYGIYMPLAAHISLYKMERARLQKQYEDNELMQKNNKELLSLVHTSKKNMSEFAVADDKKEEYCSQRMQFVFDTTTKLGLMLNGYGSCNIKDKKWYIKDSAHCQITGSLEKILSFLKTIKDSDQLIKLSHLALTRLSAIASAKEGLKENTFQLSCDVGIISIKS
jgi:hypothetical protein